MITTGIITEINISNEDSTLTNNLFKVKVPYFDNPGLDTKCIITCTASTPSNLYNPYAVGDMVYITFIDNNYSQGLIIGSIYKGVTNISRGYLLTESLKVTGTAELPASTKLGPMTVQDIIDHEEVIDNLQSSVNQLEQGVAVNFVNYGLTETKQPEDRVGLDVTIGANDYNGLYLITFGRCSMLLPCSGLTADQTYKAPGTFIYDNQGSVKTTTVNYKLTGTGTNRVIRVWSGETSYQFFAGLTFYAFRIPVVVTGLPI